MEGYAALDSRSLLRRLKSLVAEEHRHVAEVLACLAEVENRRIHEAEGYSNLFEYCLGELGYSEGEAWPRILASRAARRFPEILTLIRDGLLSFTTVATLQRILTPENKDELLQRAQGLRRLELDRLVSEFAPRPELRDTMRRVGVATLPAAAPRQAPLCGLPVPQGQGMAPGTGERQPAQAGQDPPAPDSPPAQSGSAAPLQGPAPLPPAPPPRPDHIAAATPERIQFSFTGGADILSMIKRARELLWHKVQSSRLEDVFRELLRDFLARHDPDLWGGQARKRAVEPGGRRVPLWVRQAVWKRDGGRCAYVAPSGTRCAERGGLEFDHVVPWAKGGRSDDPGNVRLLCGAHNRMAARREFGGRAPGGELGASVR